MSKNHVVKPSMSDAGVKKAAGKTWVLKILITILISGAAIFFLHEYGKSPLEKTANKISIYANIPNAIRELADRRFIELAGQTFFDEYASFDPEHSYYLPSGEECAAKPGTCSSPNDYPVYFVSYSIQDPQKPFIREQATIQVSPEGNILPVDSDHGVPRCVSRPESCVFNTSESDAIRIAKENGLEAGVKKWKVKFDWTGGDRMQYVWSVDTILTDRGGSGVGKVMLIEPGMGAVIGTSQYSWIDN